MHRKILILSTCLFLTVGIFGLVPKEVKAGSLFNFRISLTPNKGSVNKGGVLNSAVNLSLSSSKKYRVTLFAAVQPKGVEIKFRPSSCRPPCSSKITISTSGEAENKNYSIPIIATGEGVTRTATYYLTISPFPSPLSTPRLMSPIGGSTLSNLTPFLDWSKVSGAKTYYWSIGNKSGQITTSSLVVPSGTLKYNTKYYWKIKACTDSSQENCSDWSGTRRYYMKIKDCSDSSQNECSDWSGTWSFTTPKNREASLKTFQSQLTEIRASLLRLREELRKLISSI